MRSLGTVACVQPGEALHVAGADGALRAKRWLEATTRVKTVWLNTEARHAARMTFQWPHDGNSFSFDIGGIFHQGELEGDIFLAECKHYTTNGNSQGTEHRSFLAKCYVVQQQFPGFYNHFMWITWHPFKVNEWSKLCSQEYVKRSLVEERRRVLGCDSTNSAETLIEVAVTQAVSEKLWLIVLSAKQEGLVITPENRALVYGAAAEKGEL